MSDVTALVYSGLAQIHVQNEQWDEAVAVLQEGVERSATALGRIQLLLHLCNLELKRGGTDAAETHITTIESLLPDVNDYLILSAIYTCKAEMLAQRGDAGAAAIEYDRAIAQLDAHGEKTVTAALYAAKHAHVLRRGSNAAAAFDEQDRRIDLAYDGLHPLIRARLVSY